MSKAMRIVVFLCLASPLFAQQANINALVPSANYGSDSINLQTLVPIVNLPVRAKGGPLPFSASLIGASGCSLSSSTWQCSPNSNSTTNAIPLSVGELTFQAMPGESTSVTCPNSGSTKVNEYTNFVITDRAGNGMHYLPPADLLYDAYCTETISATTLDGGLTVNITTSWNGTTKVMTASGSIKDKFGNVGNIPSQQINNLGSVPLAIVTDGTLTDPFSNQLSQGSITGGYAYTDPLNPSGNVLQVLSTGTYKYVDAGGVTRSITPTTTSYTQKTSFSCSGKTDINTTGVSFITKYAFPDGTSESFGYEPNGTAVTGRINSITLRTGGSVSYTYGAMNCTQYRPLSLTRVGADGTTTFTVSGIGSGAPFASTTTVVDPGGNKVVYTFTGYYAATVNMAGLAGSNTPALTQVQTYQNIGTVMSPSYGTALSTDTYCYNGNTTSCTTAVVSYPITEIQVTRDIGVTAGKSQTVTFIDGGPTGGCAGATAPCYGNVTEVDAYDFGASTPTTKTITAYGSTSGSGGSTTCTSIGSSVFGKPCYVETEFGSNVVGMTNYKYNSKGALTDSYVLTTGSNYLHSTASPNSNGTVASVTDPNSTTVTYSYSTSTGCPSSGSGLLPTGTSVTVATGDTLTTATAYECNGGTVTSTTDSNSNVSDIAFNDPLFRLSSTADPYSFTYTPCYGTLSGGTCTASATSVSGSSTKFNSSNSQILSNGVVDTFGRPITSQVGQGPSSSNFDTVSTSYGWGGTNSTNRMVSTSAPCTATGGSNCSSFPHSTQFDPLGRVIDSATTSFEDVATTYTQNDALAVLSPHPTGENNKQTQSEYDGLGRLTSTCDISSTVTGNASCGQNTNTTAKGIVTTMQYTPGAASMTIKATRSSESRTAVSDALGRITSENYPETGGTNFTYTYDATATATCSWLTTPNLSGRLALMKDPNGNNLCYSYDAIGRLAQVNASGTSCRHYYYDNSTGYSGTIPTGVSVANNLGQMVEAATDTCASNTLVTDEWFSYDKDGRMTDLWESTPHSSGYFHISAAYWPNGALETLSGIPGYNSITYTPDGEGRPYSAVQNATPAVTLVTSVTYDPADMPLVITLGSGDTDTYTYNTNEDMKTYSFAVGTTNTDAGTMTWNGNNTLGSVAITDGFNSGGAQTCTMGYDDLARLTSDNCGMTLGSQSYAYDQYDNLQTTANGLGVTWNPSYNTNNQYTTIGATFDADGHVTYDTFNYYQWTPFGQMATDNTFSGPNCGTSGHCFTYDALGRVVEKSFGSGYYEEVYGPTGFIGLGSSLTSMSSTNLPMPGGSIMYTQGSSGAFHRYEHLDWIGSARLESDLENRTTQYDLAYTPYGTVYAKFGTIDQQTFAGLIPNFDAAAGFFDTPNRELYPTQGRWLSPDPARNGWNLYAYTTNPNSFIDPTGLCDPADPNCTLPAPGMCGDSLNPVDCSSTNPGSSPGSQVVFNGFSGDSGGYLIGDTSGPAGGTSSSWGGSDVFDPSNLTGGQTLGQVWTNFTNFISNGPFDSPSVNCQCNGAPITLNPPGKVGQIMEASDAIGGLVVGLAQPGWMRGILAETGGGQLEMMSTEYMSHDPEIMFWNKRPAGPPYGPGTRNMEKYGNHFLQGYSTSLSNLSLKGSRAATDVIEQFKQGDESIQTLITQRPVLRNFYQALGKSAHEQWSLGIGTDAASVRLAKKSGLYW